MQLMKLEERVIYLRYAQKYINSLVKESTFKVPVHLALGHEAIAVAVDDVMDDEDRLFLTHRNMHYNIARSGSMIDELAECFLGASGSGGGLYGPMNFVNPHNGIPYTSSILGNNMPVAVGYTLANCFKTGKVGLSIVQTGDGAMEEGVFYETLVMAKSYNLPILFLVEVNRWSLGTEIAERRCTISLKKMAEALEMDYHLFQSNDVGEYARDLQSIKSSVLRSSEPAILEVELASLGHSMAYDERSPDGRFINYHAGAAPNVEFDSDPVVATDETDPVYVILTREGQAEVEKIAEAAFARLSTDVETAQSAQANQA